METPIARNTDPISSHVAGFEMTALGIRDLQRSLAYMAVCDNPGHTSHELAQCSILDRYQMARRLPEIERQGLVKRGLLRYCNVSGRLALTWETV